MKAVIIVALVLIIGATIVSFSLNYRDKDTILIATGVWLLPLLVVKTWLLYKEQQKDQNNENNE